MAKKQIRRSPRLLRVARLVDGRLEVSECIRRAREDAGLSRYALAKRLGVKWDRVAEWENGKRVPLASRFLAILAICESAPSTVGLTIG